MNIDNIDSQDIRDLKRPETARTITYLNLELAPGRSEKKIDLNSSLGGQQQTLS